jgi:hypothetical protein
MILDLLKIGDKVKLVVDAEKINIFDELGNKNLVEGVVNDTVKGK